MFAIEVIIPLESTIQDVLQGRGVQPNFAQTRTSFLDPITFRRALLPRCWLAGACVRMETFMNGLSCWSLYSSTPSLELN